MSAATAVPAASALHLAVVAHSAGGQFGLWNVMLKFSIALRAVAVLPFLDLRDFVSGTENAPEVLATSSLLPAQVPFALKLLAIGLLAVTPVKEC